jgi:outer membrane protein assembly factor BamB
MGFLKKLLFTLPMFVFLIGCSTSNIKIIKSSGSMDTYPMFGKVPSREFYVPIIMGDSLDILWEAEAHGSFTQSSVTYLGDNLFINDLSGRIFCYDINTGKRLGQLKHKNPIYTTPVISKYNLIYIESMRGEDKSFVRVFNLIENKRLNEKEIEGRVRSEMLMLGQEFYFVTDKGLLYKFSHIGDQYWMVDLGSNVRSSPVSDGENLFIAADNGEILVVSTSDGEILRRIEAGNIISSGLTVSGSSIIAGERDGTVYSINKKDGEVNWTYKSGSSVAAVPVISNGTVYIVNLGGNIIALDLATGSELWLTSTDGVLNVTPLLTDNYLIIPDLSDRILFIDIKDGKQRKVIELPNRAKLSPVIHKNILIIGYDRGVIRAYEII